MRKLLALAALFGALQFGAATVAHAQTQCATDGREAVAARLLEKYGESPVAVAVTSTGALLEVYATAPGSDNDTWTITVALPDGQVCMASSGENWRGGAPAPAAAPGTEM